MYLFHNDYNQACHPNILAKMQQMQCMQMQGYGEDTVCQEAAALIRKSCGREDVFVHFLVGGTQTNLTVIAAALRPHHAVLSAHSGHINVHETGSIEAVGHKIIPLDSADGKITAQQIDDAASFHESCPEKEHIAKPKMVYISNPTELGTIYSLGELEDISAACKKHGLYLFMDGARLGYGLTAKENDLTLADLCRLTDVFYIGGTKVGALFGEAVVISNPYIAEDFRYLVKQHGGMLAKGWLLGIQFVSLFEDDLYFKIAGKANRFADQIRLTLERLNCPMLVEGCTNQIFPILPNAVLDDLGKEFTFSIQEKVDEEHTAVRFCTSWATTEEAVDALCTALTSLSK